jgi:hypothetical protein
VKGIRGLPAREQDELFAYLLESAISARPEAAGLPGQPLAGQVVGHLSHQPSRAAPSLSSIGIGPSFRAGPGGQRMVPFRLPGPLYDRLKAWCGGHGFAMAVVMRGLVERFLDEQEALSPREAPETAKKATRTSRPRKRP